MKFQILNPSASFLGTSLVRGRLCFFLPCKKLWSLVANLLSAVCGLSFGRGNPSPTTVSIQIEVRILRANRTPLFCCLLSASCCLSFGRGNPSPTTLSIQIEVRIISVGIADKEIILYYSFFKLYSL